MYGLIFLFFLTALLYASVGFGGGSTYNALLVLGDTDYRLLPMIALTCNIIVVTGGVWQFARKGVLPLRRMLPFLVASVPMAWIGGRLPVSETVFIGLLGGALLFSGVQLLFQKIPEDAASTGQADSWALGLSLGGGIGLLSGIVGIGGGIFLAPVLYLMRWGTARQIAAAASLFILANSLSGLFGQLVKSAQAGLVGEALAYWPLLLAVFIGGQIGTRAGALGLPASWLKRMTAVLILYVAGRLLIRWMLVVA